MSLAKQKKRVGILRGGTDEYYEDSLRDGGEMIAHITEHLGNDWQPFDILIDRTGVWHFAGLPIKPSELLHKVDVVLNVSHPSFASVLENLFIPNVGPSSFSYGLAEDRAMLASHLKKIGVKMPRHLIFPYYQPDFDGSRERYSIKKAKEVHEKFTPPWIVKSLTPDSNLGVHLAQTFPELVNAIEDITVHGKSILIEEFISDRTASVHSVPGFRGSDLYTFPIGKYSSEEKENLLRLARDIYRQIGANHYLLTNFAIHPRRGIYLTSLELLPDLKDGSHLGEVCQSVGSKTSEIVKHMLESVL